ncbi:hypothetical protein Pflav_082890 [Phytohabitans flavus]|uniref:Uncharacterized protein n=1 Tax=Phytohabitans flavus TaxID=1076124 RepID=A0A6F8Y774_9ACTN|nr:hypothetical protein Pflav_082890 [Phytohabitans flavus]
MTSATLLTRAVGVPNAAEATGPLLRARLRMYERALMVLDLTIISLAVLAGYFGRFNWVVEPFGGGEPVGSQIPYPVVGPGLVLVWLAFLKVTRCYDDRVLGHGADEYRRVTSASLRLAGAIAIFGYVANVGVARASWP